MSHRTLTHRMATGVALALTAAAITACGGGADTAIGTAATASGTDASTPGQASATATATASASGTSAQTTPPVNGIPPLTVDRPAGNTGTGFFVAGGKLYDPNGVEFRIRGINRAHYDSPGSPTGDPLSGTNTARIALDFTKTATYNTTLVTKQFVANKIVPIPSNWGGTCKSDTASLGTVVDTWVAQAATWAPVLNASGILNIANEWGPPNSTVWRDSYISAIQSLRAAGYTGTLMIDAGGCGQDSKDIINYGAAVLAADPQQNILFDVHVYGNFYYPATATWQQDYTTAMAALKATGLPIVLGEFGPGRNVGPSPTLLTPTQIINTAEANGWGWMAWAWDDNNLAACAADNNWFSMTTNCGFYTGQDATELTTFGQAVVPLLKQLAVKATNF